MAKKPTEWWATTFDQKYLDTYVDIATDTRTKSEIKFLTKTLKIKKGSRILDLACGYGRHAIPLLRLGYDVTGVDASRHFIALAKERAKKEKLDGNFVLRDMRRLNMKSEFDLVLSMFSSFGYFKDEADNERVLQNIARALKPKGRVLFDLNNTLRSLQWIPKTTSHTDTLSNGLVVTTDNALDPNTLRWSMTRSWKQNGKTKKYATDMRLYTLPEFSKMLSEAGLKVTKTWGNFDASIYGLSSPRLIVLAEKG